MIGNSETDFWSYDKQLSSCDVIVSRSLLLSIPFVDGQCIQFVQIQPSCVVLVQWMMNTITNSQIFDTLHLIARIEISAFVSFSLSLSLSLSLWPNACFVCQKWVWRLPIGCSLCLILFQLVESIEFLFVLVWSLGSCWVAKAVRAVDMNQRSGVHSFIQLNLWPVATNIRVMHHFWSRSIELIRSSWTRFWKCILPLAYRSCLHIHSNCIK
jgi:hypothetical protein